MNRQFKFKAWDIKNKKMLVVCKIDFLEQRVYLEDERKESFNNICLMQYTGLHDKKGKEIYEGDIISINDEKTSVKLPVKFGKYAFEKYIGDCGEITDSNDIYGFYVENEYLYTQMINENTIIVGNIYNNENEVVSK